MAKWFEVQERAGRLTMEHSNTTYRSIQSIADFADRIFTSDHGFSLSRSANHRGTEHDGVFVVSLADFPQYQAGYSPQCLRDDVRRGAGVDADFQTFGIVKGRTWTRVPLCQLKVSSSSLRVVAALPDKTACGLYVAVTRGRAECCIRRKKTHRDFHCLAGNRPCIQPVSQIFSLREQSATLMHSQGGP